ncbi:MAG: hypothetical protein EOP51_12450 [Sphingobacteriales bacterium]|nr:MAG: hypothetical protein EOP51_12450 [Sphingobacteriales bacterium]
MKILKTALIAFSTVSLFACNASNADNPSNSAPSPESDTATESTTDLNSPAYNGAVADTTKIVDTLPAK